MLWSNQKKIIFIHSHSFGQVEGGPLEWEREAFQQFYEDGLLIIASAGNHGDSRYAWPASYDSVISVAGMCHLQESHALVSFLLLFSSFVVPF
jgi:hypothetical protein